MTITAKPLAALVVAILFSGILFSSAMGWWQTESTKEAATFTSGEFAGQANPADIRGSYTFGDVENNFGVPAVVLAQAFGIPDADPAAYPVKSLEALYLDSGQEVGTGSVRLFVALYLGLPYDLSTDTYLPESAAILLRERDLDAERAAYLEAHIVPAPGAEAPVDAAPTEAAPAAAPEAGEPTATPGPQKGTGSGTPPADAEHEASSDTTIKGKTTFADVLAWGVTAEAIEQALGKPMPAAPGMKIKDFCTENGLSFETVKAALQAEVDRVVK